jgi:hypothetical protein
MKHKGVGENAIHTTQVEVSASLLSRGVTVDEVVQTIFDATCQAAGAEGNSWNWTEERQNIRRMCHTWLAKHPEITEKKVDPHSDNKRAETIPGGRPADDLINEWDVGEDTDPIPPRRWLLGNQFCKEFGSSLLGAGGTGKSALRMVQYLSLATGRPLSGQHVFRRCRVVSLSFEDSREEQRRRIRAAMIHHAISHDDVRGWFFTDTPKGVKFAEMKQGTRQAGQLEKALRHVIARRKPDLIALDPFIKTHGLDENDNPAMDLVCDMIARIAIEHDIAFDTPHHTKTGQATAGDSDAGRGASASRDAWRLVYTLTVMSQDEAKMFDISEVDRRAYIRLDPAKVNITPSAVTATWFKLVGVRLGNETEEYLNGDEVQTVEPWSPPDTWADLSTVMLNAALTEIDNGMPNGQRYSKASAATERAAWRVVQRHCPNKSEQQCRQIINTWVKNEVVYEEDYDDPVDRKKRGGLRVNNAKRPS